MLKIGTQTGNSSKVGQARNKASSRPNRKNSDIESSSYKSLYSKFLEKLNSNRENYQKSVFGSLQTDREKWNCISQVRNSKKYKTNIKTFKKQFWEISLPIKSGLLINQSTIFPNWATNSERTERDDLLKTFSCIDIIQVSTHKPFCVKKDL